MTEVVQMTQLLLPWFTPDGILQYSAMTITMPSKVRKKPTMRIIRKWYRKEIGVHVDKITLDKIWSARHTTTPIAEDVIKEELHRKALESYEAVKAESSS